MKALGVIAALVIIVVLLTGCGIAEKVAGMFWH